jgi:hypothetical protein
MMRWPVKKGAQNLDGFLVLEVIKTPAEHFPIKRHNPFFRVATRQQRAVFSKARLKLSGRSALNDRPNGRIGRQALPIQAEYRWNYGIVPFGF